MQAVVKKPHIKLDGEITDKLVAYLTKEYGEIEGITDVDDELAEVTKSDWYRSASSLAISHDRTYRTWRTDIVR